MCGITGIFATSGVPPTEAELDRMTATVTHRGPDGHGVWVDGPVGFGHRRLSIIDLHSGAQPMHSADGRYAITYNGEIYNYRRLRDALTARGYVFRTQSDTEVILALYELDGDAGFEALSGMFAFGLWDRPNRRLVLARDRLGIKPLYIMHTTGRLAFASEIKALRTVADRTLTINPQAVNDLFFRQYIGVGHTIYQEVTPVLPGTIVSVTMDGTTETRYWSLEHRSDRPRNAEEALDEALAASVRRHLVSDVPVGLFLSGGIDSTSLLAYAHREGTTLDTFAVGFDGDFARDETPYARAAAERYGARHHVVTVTASEGLSALPKIVQQLDQPLADYACVPTYIMSRFAAEHVKVVLSGEGADELFGGYRRYRTFAIRDMLSLHGRLATLPLSTPPAAVLGDRGRRRLLRDHFIPAKHLVSEQRMRRDLHAHLHDDAVNRALHADLGHWLPANLLAKVDSMSMLASLEARVPYLDAEVVELVTALPGRFKVGLRGRKRILRRVTADMIPEAIRSRPKQGFTVPVGAWLRGPLRDTFDQVVFAHGSANEWLRTDLVRRLWGEHLRGRNHGLKLWTILMFAWWADEHR